MNSGSPANDAANQLLLTVGEAARRLAMSERGAWSLVLSGALPSVRVGRLRRVAVTDLHDYVSNAPRQTPRTPELPPAGESIGQEDNREGQNLAVVEGGHATGLAHTE